VSLSRRIRAEQTYRITLLTFAGLAILLSLLIVAIVEQGAVGDTFSAALRDVSALNETQMRVAAELTLIPLAMGVLTYALAAQGIRLLRLSIYLRTLHQTTGARLQRAAPLFRLRRRQRGADLPLALAIDARGRPLGKPTTLAHAIARSPHTLLLGTAGSGKTTALLGLAYEASRARELIPMYLGRRALPALISLTQYAAASSGAYDTPNLDFVAGQIGAYSSPGFTARIPAYLRRRRVLLLCDDLDEASDAELGRVIGHLARFGVRPYRRVTVLATADIATRHLAPLQLGDKGGWRTLQLTAPEARDSRLLVAATLRRGAKGAEDWPALLRAHLLDNPARLPVTLTAVAFTPSETVLPYGVARLLAAQCRRQCEAVATEATPASFLLQFLGGLASALCASGEHAVSLEPATEVGPSVGAWLDAHRPQAPAARRQSGAIGLSNEQLNTLCQAGVDAGLLIVSPDGAALRFTHRLIEATFAALWLLDHDDPTALLDPRLLGERWAIPLLFWAGLSDRPERVADGLLHLRDTSKSVALRIGLKQYAAVQPTALALALATIFYGSAVQLAALGEIVPAPERAVAHVETRLRAILDEALASVSDPPQADVIITSMRRVWQRCRPELDISMRSLASAPLFGRLTQAEVYTCLGLFASPAANLLLIERLGEREPTVRAGVTRGLTLAGYAALPDLQAQMASADEGIRMRATEIIDAIGASDEEGDTSVHRRAVHVLTTGAPDQRVAAAETLGALQAHPAVDPLIARLRDRDPEVRAAAARALGRLAEPAALAPLRSALRHANPELRVAITEALGAYQSTEVTPDLARLLADSVPAVRVAAANALSQIPDDAAVTALKAHASDPDSTTQAVILSALRRLGQR
jgi:HEAT repeat protein